MFGHPELGFQCQRRFPELLELLPPGPDLGEPALRRFTGACGSSLGVLGRSQTLRCLPLGLLQLGKVRKPGAERIYSCPKRRTLFLEPILSNPQALIAEDTR